jgi:signal peptidase I
MTEPADNQPTENIKETLLSILMAFILALIVRVFVVQAYVIPSGSMAPTLLGAHLRFRCPDCGYDFAVNFPSPSTDDAAALPANAGPLPVGKTDEHGKSIMEDTVFSIRCPNCGLKMPADASNADSESSARNTPVHYGDRILVFKSIYEFQQPRRWDVSVFISPWSVRSGRYDYDINFIKRLVGLPGESLMVLDGDVYTSASAEMPPEQQHWTIQTKPAYAQEALWRVVYDNDFYPLRAKVTAHAETSPSPRPSPAVSGEGEKAGRWTFPWQPAGGSGWNVETPGGPGRTLHFGNLNGPGRLRFNPDANPDIFPLTDWLAYDATKPLDAEDGFVRGNKYHMEPYGQEMVPRWNVSDLKLQFLYERSAGDGALEASLTKLGHRFVARIGPRVAEVYHEFPDGRQAQLIGSAPLDGLVGKPRFVEFSNVDYRVTLRIDDQDVVRSSPGQYAPDVPALLSLHQEQDRLTRGRAAGEQIRKVFPRATVEIVAEKQTASLTHLSLWRDVYYTPSFHDGGFTALTNGRPDAPIHLSAGDGDREPEYFFLGDNSILSADGRLWGSRVGLGATENLEVEAGRVPRRFLLGRAFYVYWPAGYRPFSDSGPDIVPNFGGMRLIR